MGIETNIKNELALNINSEQKVTVIKKDFNMMGHKVPLKMEYDLSQVPKSEIEIVLLIIQNL